jgi:hypothetical protein
MNFTKNSQIKLSREILPSISKKGFKVRKVPKKVWKIISDYYKKCGRVSIDQHNGLIPQDELSYIASTNDIENFYKLEFDVLNSLGGIHQKWAGSKNPLSSNNCYGIRVYKKGAICKPHYDHLATHHVSSIIIVDKDLGSNNNEDWHFDIKGNDGKWRKVYANIGEMVFYESAKCLHGRLFKFKGNSFKNFFVHYSFSQFI